MKANCGQPATCPDRWTNKLTRSSCWSECSYCASISTWFGARIRKQEEKERELARASDPNKSVMTNFSQLRKLLPGSLMQPGWKRESRCYQPRVVSINSWVLSKKGQQALTQSSVNWRTKMGFLQFLPCHVNISKLVPWDRQQSPNFPVRPEPNFPSPT